MTANGRLDTRTLTKVDGWAYLAANTAAAWGAACDEMVALGYERPSITAPDGAYRTYDQQVYWKAYWRARGKPGNAATPGFSNHGWGTDVDIHRVDRFPRAVLRDVFQRHGFTFNVLSESWHAHHNGVAPASRPSIPITKRRARKMDYTLVQAPGLGAFVIRTSDGAVRSILGVEVEAQKAAGVLIANVPKDALELHIKLFGYQTRA